MEYRCAPFREALYAIGWPATSLRWPSFLGTGDAGQECQYPPCTRRKSGSGPQFVSRCRNASFEFQGRKYEGSLLLERCRVVYFPSSDLNLNESMSLVADARVAWGGHEAVRAVTSYSRLEHCEDLVFGPKYSLGCRSRHHAGPRCTIGGAGSFCPSGDHV